MGVSLSDLFDLIKVTLDSAPPELKARMAAMTKQIEQEREERSFVFSAVAEALEIVSNLHSCERSNSIFTPEYVVSLIKAANAWTDKYNAIDIADRLEALIDRRD